CWVQVAPERVKIQAAPMLFAPLLLSRGPPISAVLPSEDRATLPPNSPPLQQPAVLSPPPVSFSPCWVQVEPERVKTQTAPTPLLSTGPPISAVLPSAASATLAPSMQ